MTRGQFRASLLAGACLLAGVSVLAAPDPMDARRTVMAIELFPRLLALDLDLDRKFIGNQCLLMVVYGSDEGSAQPYADSLTRKLSRVRGRPVVVSTVRVTELGRQSTAPVALLLVERLDPVQLDTVKKYSREHQRLLFSPFPGDVERGVSAGLYFGPRVLLLFNVQELKQSSIRIDPEVLRLSKLYE